MPAISETYGEILSESMEKLLRSLKLTKEDVFIDLGSGRGKVVLQTFLTTPIRAAYGIEINSAHHQAALLTQCQLEAQFSEKFSGRKLAFMLGDFLDMSFQGATVALIASPCFGPSILNPLGKRLNETKTIHTVISLRPLPTLTRLKFKKIIRLECSWDTALCYLYSLVK